MLVLSRKVGEKVVVPDCDLTVSVVAIRGNRVRLGIEAPRELAVHREEVLQRDLADAQLVRADETDVAGLATPRPR